LHPAHQTRDNPSYNAYPRRFESKHGRRFMQCMRQHDIDGVDLRIGQGIFESRVDCGARAVGHGPGACGIHIDGGRDLKSRPGIWIPARCDSAMPPQPTRASLSLCIGDSG